MAEEISTVIPATKRTTKTTKAVVGVGKGKKREVKRNIPTELIPVEEETWLLQPIAVTMMRHDYSLIQIRILVTIVEFMQNKLHKILNKEKMEPGIFSDVELDNDGRLEIKTLFKTLGVDPNHYPQLRQSLKMLAAIPVEIPYKTTDGRSYLKVTNLCDVYIPKDTGLYEKYALLKIDRTVAQRLVSLDLGYHRLGKQIVFACRNRYTQRIYMFIESWLDKGGTRIKTLDFRKMLRLENNYNKFSDFTRRVLNPAKEELQSLAENGFCDCYFDYEKRYNHGQRGGEPDELVFTIFRAKNKLNHQLKDITEMQRNQFSDMLMRYFGFEVAVAKKMSERVTPENYQGAVSKLVDLRNRLRSDLTIHDRAAYTYRVLDNLFRGV
ncbi:replication initiation protein [Hallella colorans]|uniref:Replication initiator protein n=1 Tax=Hallella colorans TaxID=1703337 RepID=A0A2U0TYW1_9BACT|nr:replication initiation protein [Hallella colorans]PVX48768.1 replication initiator protein [Hallella colorans]